MCMIKSILIARVSTNTTTILRLTLGLIVGIIIYERYGEKKRIVFITAYDTVIYRAFEVRAWRYIVKPVKKEILYEAIDSFLSENKECGTLTVRHDRQTRKPSWACQWQHSCSAVPTAPVCIQC